MKNRELANLIKDRRMQLRMSQNELAAKAIISQGYVGWIEKGERVPSREVARRLSSALELPEDEIFRAAGYIPRGDQIYLDDEEIEVVRLYRESSPETKAGFLMGLRAARDERERRRNEA